MEVHPLLGQLDCLLAGEGQGPAAGPTNTGISPGMRDGSAHVLRCLKVALNTSTTPSISQKCLASYTYPNLSSSTCTSSLTPWCRCGTTFPRTYSTPPSLTSTPSWPK